MQLFEIYQYIFLGVAFVCLIALVVAWYAVLAHRDKKASPSNSQHKNLF